LAQKELIAIESSSSLGEAVQTLFNNDIYSAPVGEVATRKFSALLDLQDATAFLVSLFPSEEPPSDLAELDAISRRFNDTPVSSVVNFSGKNPFQEMPMASLLSDVIEALVRGKNSRVVLTNESGQAVNMISQATVVKYLADHVELIGPKGKETVGELGIATKPVQSVSQTTPGLQALKRLVRLGVSHLALVNEEGRLTGNLSVKDVRVLLRPGALRLLLGPVQELVHTSLRDNLKDPVPIVHADYSHSLERLIRRLAAVRIHRIYITDSAADLYPSGVVALSDVLSVYTKH